MALKLPPPETPSLNLTPMIDIVFLLIIFFMVGTKFAEIERKIALEVPQVSQSGTMEAVPKARTVNVYRDGRLELDKQEIGLTALTGKLTEAIAAYPKLSVMVRGDGETSFQQVAEVLAACRKAGVADLGITVQIAKRDRSLR